MVTLCVARLGFDPTTGRPPGGHEDTGQQLYPVDVRGDGIYVSLEAEAPREATVTDVRAETMTNWEVTTVFGMVDALRLQEQQGRLTYYGIRHEGGAAFACAGYAKLTGKPAACLTIAGPGATNLMTGLWDAHVDRAGGSQVLGPGAFQEIDLAAAFAPADEVIVTLLRRRPLDLTCARCHQR